SFTLSLHAALPSWIDDELDEGGTPVPPDEAERLLQRRTELRGSLDAGAEAAEGLGIANEVRIGQRAAVLAPGILALLVHADRPVHAVVEEQHQDAGVVLGRGGELARAHEQVAAAGEADDVTIARREAAGHLMAAVVVLGRGCEFARVY